MYKNVKKEKFKIKSNVTFELFDKNGKLKMPPVKLHNTSYNCAKYGIMDQLLAAPTLAKPGWMELGTGSPGATLLGAYIAGSRTAFDSKTRANAVITMIASFAAGVGTGLITEAGIFDVVTQNTINMWASATGFTAIPKAADDTMVVTWTFTLS